MDLVSASVEKLEPLRPTDPEEDRESKDAAWLEEMEEKAQRGRHRHYQVVHFLASSKKNTWLSSLDISTLFS